MARYIPRTQAPSHNDERYYSDQNIYYACGYGMPNCTAYAWGRLWELTGKRYDKLVGNAEVWWNSADKAGLKKGQEPKLGAIAVWRGGEIGNSKDGAGHVAVVEEIKPNGDIVTSNSGWKSYEFEMRTVEKAKGYNYSVDKEFVGFIYCGIEYDTEPVYTRVQIGAFTIKANAVRRAKEVQAKGYKAILKKNGIHYRVQVGAYTVYDNAVNMLKKMKELGYSDAYITNKGGTDVSF